MLAQPKRMGVPINKNGSSNGWLARLSLHRLVAIPRMKQVGPMVIAAAAHPTLIVL